MNIDVAEIAGRASAATPVSADAELEQEARRILSDACADSGCGIPSPFDEVAEHAVRLALTKSLDRDALANRCTEIADEVIPQYRADNARHTGCGSHTAKRWQAAWDGACVALSGDPAEYRR